VDLDTGTELVLVVVQLQPSVERTALACPRIKDSARYRIVVCRAVGAPGLAGLPVAFPVEQMASGRGTDTATVPPPYTLEHFTTAEDFQKIHWIVTTTAFTALLSML